MILKQSPKNIVIVSQYFRKVSIEARMAAQGIHNILPRCWIEFARINLGNDLVAKRVKRDGLCGAK
jgi:hypothetical protein